MGARAQPKEEGGGKRERSAIIPQAISARYGLAISAKCSLFVLGLMYLFSPIAYPTAKLLDRVLGAEEEHTYKKAELK